MAIKNSKNVRYTLVEGEYRVFDNFYHRGKQYTFGWPHPDCPDQRVWIGLNSTETNRISQAKAKVLLQAANYDIVKLIGSSAQTLRLGPSSSTGFCIRCKVKIDFDVDKPFCYKCYKSWKRYENESYSEKYCHKYGHNSSQVSFARPLCNKCYHSS